MNKLKLLLFFIFFVPLTSVGFSKSPQQEQPTKQELPDLLKKSKSHSYYLDLIKKYPQISREAFINALSFYEDSQFSLKKEGLCFSEDNKNNRLKIRNLSCVIIADYSQSKRKPRLLFLDPVSKTSEVFYTAHGKGSNAPQERESGEIAIQFSNRSGSNMTSLGYYLTDQLYTSQKKTFGPGPRNGLKLDGISCSNNKARKRYVVFHTAQYVPEISAGPEGVGNSEGCITLPKNRKDVLKACAGGALVYAYAKNK